MSRRLVLPGFHADALLVRGLYKYPHAEFPYRRLVEENARRTRKEREFEIHDTGVFDEQRYFDVFVEYAKAGPDDVLIRIEIQNRGPEPADLCVLPTLWFRNTWSWGARHGAVTTKPSLRRQTDTSVTALHETLGEFEYSWEQPAEPLFTENETNQQAVFGAPAQSTPAKDGFHRYVIHGEEAAIRRDAGTKCAPLYRLTIPAGGSHILRLRLRSAASSGEPAFGPAFDETISTRLSEADAFYATKIDPALTADQARVVRQGYAGLLWSQQFYSYIVKDWLRGDPGEPPPPAGHATIRNSDWQHLYANDVLSMPDKWEYPWFAAWDLAFHMIPMARVDPEFAKAQLELFLREWYMHPNGQMPAYEWNFSDVNPPVHAWACWRVYKIAAPGGQRDLALSGALLPEAAAEFHLVGESQGHRGPPHFRRRLSRAG